VVGDRYSDIGLLM